MTDHTQGPAHNGDAMTEVSVPQSLSTTLKAATHSLHQTAEQHPMQKALVGGRLTRGAYAGMLAQFHLVHEALESAIHTTIDAGGSTGEALSAVWRPQLAHADQVLADMAFFGGSRSAPTPATEALVTLIDDLAATKPLGLLGLNYVLEGSINGSRFIAVALRKVYELSGSDGTQSLDPYGDRQVAVWKRWKHDLDALGLTGDDRAIVIASAETMFKALVAIFDDLHEPLAV